MKVGNSLVLIEILLIGVIYLSVYIIVFIGRIKNKFIKIKKKTLPIEAHKNFSVKRNVNQL